MSLAGKVAVITGGGQGIGLGISQAMLAAGAQILVAQRNPLPDELSDASWIEADLTQPDIADWSEHELDTENLPWQDEDVTIPII